MDKAFHQSIRISQLKQRGDNYLRKVFPDEPYAYQIRRELQRMEDCGITYQVHGHCLNVAADGSCAGHAAPVLPTRTDEGAWVHPALQPALETAEDQSVLEDWIERNQLDVSYTSIEQDGYVAGSINLNEWEPAPPSKNAFLLMLTESDKGPIAMWATSHLQIDDYVLVDGKQYPCIKV